jgi:putative FmdB family regulatory protein
MPIYEFRCLNCNELFERLLMNTEEMREIHCPSCNATTTEQVMSSANFSVSGGTPGGTSHPGSQTRKCSGGSCTTYDIPGPK